MPAHLADDRRPMEEVIAGLPTKSAMIRALDREGYSRAEIARFLGLRYQHVRNVLVQAPSEASLDEVRARVGPGGRVLIPAPYREALRMKEGDEVVMRVEGDALRLETRAARVRRAQERVARCLRGERHSVDAFLAERQREVEREKVGG